MLMLVVIGSLLPVHVRRGWHLRKNLLAGCAMGTLALLLIASGYALYYFSGEEVRPWISAFHWVLGLGAPLALTWHVRRGRRAYATHDPHQDHKHTPAAASTQHSPGSLGTKRVDPDPRAQVSRPSISA